MKSRGQNEVAAQINSWRARCHILISLFYLFVGNDLPFPHTEIILNLGSHASQVHLQHTLSFVKPNSWLTHPYSPVAFPQSDEISSITIYSHLFYLVEKVMKQVISNCCIFNKCFDIPSGTCFCLYASSSVRWKIC